MCQLDPCASALVGERQYLDTTHVQRNAWREAGYDAFPIAGRDRVRFKRTD